MNIGDDSDYDYEADRKDAERYRWLKARHPQALASIAWGASSNACQFPAEQLDDAVDQAMRAWPNPNPVP